MWGELFISKYRPLMLSFSILLLPLRLNHDSPEHRGNSGQHFDALMAASFPSATEELGVPEVQDDAQRAPADGVAVDAVHREPDAADREPVVAYQEPVTAHRELAAARVEARDVHHERRLDAAGHEDSPRDGNARDHAPKPWACT